MKSKRAMIVPLGAVCVVGAMLAVVHAQQGDKTKQGARTKSSTLGSGPVTKGLPGASTAPVAGGLQPATQAASWPVTILWTLNLNQNQQNLYEEMALVLSSYTTVPQDRLDYYSAVNSPPGSVINGWSGVLTNVQAEAGGSYLVTVLVSPYLSTATYGAVTSVDTDYSEQFTINANDQVTYVGFLDPLGYAGETPTKWSN